jgi:hypothetical protein
MDKVAGLMQKLMQVLVVERGFGDNRGEDTANLGRQR